MSAIQSQHSSAPRSHRALSQHSDASSSDSEVEILSRKGSKMSGGKIAGIVIGSVVAGVLITLGTVYTVFALKNVDEKEGMTRFQKCRALDRKAYSAGAKELHGRVYKHMPTKCKNSKLCKQEDVQEPVISEDRVVSENPVEEAETVGGEEPTAAKKGWCGLSCGSSQAAKDSDNEDAAEGAQ